MSIEEFTTSLPEEYQNTFTELITLLKSNKHREGLFGSSENNRAERSEIIYKLNYLCLASSKISFNELSKDWRL